MTSKDRAKLLCEQLEHLPKEDWFDHIEYVIRRAISEERYRVISKAGEWLKDAIAEATRE